MTNAIDTAPELYRPKPVRPKVMREKDPKRQAIGRMSRRKGGRGEREAAKFLIEIGFAAAYRTRQRHGSKDSPDITCGDLPNVLIEVKYREAVKMGSAALGDAMRKAASEAKGGAYAVLWRANREPWKLTFVASKPALEVTVCGGTEIRHALLFLNQRERPWSE